MTEESFDRANDRSTNQSRQNRDRDEIEAQPSTGKRKEKALKKRKARVQNIADRLAELQSAARAITQSHLANLDGSIEEIMTSIRDVESADNKKNKLKRKTLKKMSATLDGLSIEPEEGRRRDLKRIEQTVQQLLRHISKKNGK